MKKMPTNLKIILGFIVAFILLITLVVSVEDEKASDKAVAENKEEASTGNGIPGSNPVDIFTGLEDNGYKVDKQYDSEGNFYYCTKSENGIDYNITIAGSKDEKVAQVKISASLNGQESKNIIAVKPFIKHFSTMPYDDSDINKIAQWVEDNFNNDKASTIIGSVKFSLFASSKWTRLLLIEKA